jgi:hypothetical protein
MFLIDIAVPRDIDPAVNELDAVYLYDMDDLQQVVAANLEGRMQEADKAEAIIDRLLGKRLDQAAPGTAWAVCMGAEHSPVISAEYARQHAIWVSYLKLTFKAGNS